MSGWNIKGRRFRRRLVLGSYYYYYIIIIITNTTTTKQRFCTFFKKNACKYYHRELQEAHTKSSFLSRHCTSSTQKTKHYAAIVEVTCCQGQLEKMCAPGRIVIRRPFKPTEFAKLFRARSQITYNFRRNSFACGNLSLLAPNFRLFQ